MLEQLVNADKIMLVHWTYSREEWGRFLGYSTGTRWLFRLRSLFRLRAPEVWISARHIWIGSRERINMRKHEVNSIDLREEGPVNILAIFYRVKDHRHIRRLKIVVPKGKLREALEVQRSLTGTV